MNDAPLSDAERRAALGHSIAYKLLGISDTLSYAIAEFEKVSRFLHGCTEEQFSAYLRGEIDPRRLFP